MSYLCPVCRAPRKTQLTDQISYNAHIKIGLTVLACSGVALVVWDSVAAIKSSFLYLPLWSAAEFFHWVKMRDATKCKTCGFDPILYRRDWRAARKQVEERLNGVVSELKSRAVKKPNESGPVTASKNNDTPPKTAP